MTTKEKELDLALKESIARSQKMIFDLEDENKELKSRVAYLERQIKKGVKFVYATPQGGVNAKQHIQST